MASIKFYLLSKQVTFQKQPSEQSHTLNSLKANFMNLSAGSISLRLQEVAEQHRTFLWSLIKVF